MGPTILWEGSFHNIRQKQFICTQLSRKYEVVTSLHRTAHAAWDHMHWLWWKCWILTPQVSDEINYRLCKNHQLLYTLEVQACYKSCNSRVPLKYCFFSFSCSHWVTNLLVFPGRQKQCLWSAGSHLYCTHVRRLKESPILLSTVQIYSKTPRSHKMLAVNVSSKKVNHSCILNHTDVCVIGHRAGGLSVLPFFYFLHAVLACHMMLHTTKVCLLKNIKPNHREQNPYWLATPMI